MTAGRKHVDRNLVPHLRGFYKYMVVYYFYFAVVTNSLLKRGHFDSFIHFDSIGVIVLSLWDAHL